LQRTSNSSGQLTFFVIWRHTGLVRSGPVSAVAAAERRSATQRGEVRAYLFIKTRIHDPEQYAKYVAEVRQLAARWQSRYIARSRPIEVLEGSPEQWGDFLLLRSSGASSGTGQRARQVSAKSVRPQAEGA
jgi:hypothetical protein